MIKKIKSENGSTIIEATLVFPVIFLVIFLLFFMGNAYYQKCRIDAIVHKAAVDGAALCANPSLSTLSVTRDSGDPDAYVVKGFPDTAEDLSVQPYKVVIGDMADIEESIKKDVDSKITKLDSGLFSGMKPKTEVDLKVDFDNHLVYSSFIVQYVYKIDMPISLGGNRFSMKVASRYNAAVTNTPEFIRTVTMAEDLILRHGGAKIKEKYSSIIETLSNFAEFKKK